MPDHRNTFRRLVNHPRVVAMATLGCAGSALMIACADGGITAPAAPSARAAAHASAADSSEQFRRDSVKFAEVARKDSIEAAQDAAKAAAKVEKNLAKAQLDSLRAEWKAYKAAVKRTGVKADILRCEPQPRQRVAKTIGPKGGELRFGPHRLVIPAGALPLDVEIAADAPSDQAVRVEFSPHGLQFAKPVELTIDYKQCIVPDAEELEVSYLLNGWWAVERMPSMDVRKDKKITAITDHFSGYAITWGRSRTY